MFVSVKICAILEFVKRLFKVLAKFYSKNISTIGTGYILNNGNPTQFLIKMGAETNSFVCNNVRWKRKIRKTPVLRKCVSYSPSYATFSMKRFFLTSVYIFRWKRKYLHTTLQLTVFMAIISSMRSCHHVYIRSS